MDIVQEVKTVEKDLLEIIAEHLIQNKIQVNEARKLAADFLKILPVTDHQDLLAKLKNLGQEHEEVQEVYVKEFGKASDMKKDIVLNQMRDAIAKGNIDHAVTIAKGGQQ